MTVRAAVIFALLGPVAATGGALWPSAVAIAAPAAPPADAASKAARELFKRAEVNFNLLKFAEALGDYQAAYQAKPLPGFLFNIAQCHRNMGQYERARFFFRRYLVLDPRTSNRPQVEDLIAEMTRLLEKQEAALAPTAAASGIPATTEPEARRAPVAVPAALPPARTADPSLLITQAPSPPSRRPVYKRWWFWGGVAAAVIGGTTAALLLTRGDNVPHGSLEPINARP